MQVTEFLAHSTALAEQLRKQGHGHTHFQSIVGDQQPGRPEKIN